MMLEDGNLPVALLHKQLQALRSDCIGKGEVAVPAMFAKPGAEMPLVSGCGTVPAAVHPIENLVEHGGLRYADY